MKCFYHSERDAVGICKNCQKGLCTECAADTGDGLACRQICEDKVIVVNQLVNRNVRASSQWSGTYLVAPIISGVMGIIFLSMTLNIVFNPDSRFGRDLTVPDYLMFVGGFVFLALALYLYVVGRKVVKK